MDKKDDPFEDFQVQRRLLSLQQERERGRGKGREHHYIFPLAHPLEAARTHIVMGHV